MPKEKAMKWSTEVQGQLTNVVEPIDINEMIDRSPKHKVVFLVEKNFLFGKAYEAFFHNFLVTIRHNIILGLPILM